jgi:cell wall-associated NlpC family hydrolase
MAERRIATEYAMSFCGAPYRWGGENPIEGFDCSGFVQEIMRALGLNPPQDMTSAQLRAYYKKNEINLPTKESVRECPPGVLLFYGKHKITHVAMSIGYGLMIEAGGGGSSTKTTQDAAKAGAFVRIRPILRRGDLVAATDPIQSVDPWCGA